MAVKVMQQHEASLAEEQVDAEEVEHDLDAKSIKGSKKAKAAAKGKPSFDEKAKAVKPSFDEKAKAKVSVIALDKYSFISRGWGKPGADNLKLALEYLAQQHHILYGEKVEVPPEATARAPTYFEDRFGRKPSGTRQKGADSPRRFASPAEVENLKLGGWS